MDASSKSRSRKVSATHRPAQGQPLPHDSAARHVSGTAVYVDDMLEPEGTVHLAPGYASSATLGPIRLLDLDAVRKAPQVIRVLTAADIPGLNDCSPSLRDDPILADGRIEFHGQVIFAVIAATRDAARRAARLARIEIDEQEPIVTIEDALKANSEILAPYQFIRGDVEAGLARSPRRLKGSVHMGGQEHFYLEGQVSLAVPRENGEVVVYCSTQHPTEIQHCVAKMLARPDAAVVCECRRMGGGFGGKESQAAQWAALAALAASLTGRPAKIRLDRDDDMIMTGKRHDFRIDYQAGFDAKGKLRAVDATLNGRCGYSADLSLGVNDRAMFHSDNCYFYPQTRIFSRRLKTNTASATAFRGFGGPQGMLFAEQMMDSIARTLRLDPLEVRKRNFYRTGHDTTPYGQKLKDNIIAPLVEELERTSGYRARRRKIAAFNDQNDVLKKGIALTPVKFGISFTLTQLNQAGALVHLFTDGSVQINHAGTEMGQGLYIKVAQVVADEFGIPVDRVRITATTTDKVPNTSATAASSGSDLNGMAAKAAAGVIKDRLVDFAARHFNVARSKIAFAGGIAKIGSKTMTLGELAARAHSARVQLSSTGFYATPEIFWDRAKASGSPFFYFAYGAACSEVTIDTLTGELRIDRVDILHDVGKSLNPAVDLGQIEGGFVQGMGWLTTEELVFDSKGKLLTHAPSTYKIPTASDVPADFRVRLWKSKGNRADTIYRSKAVGEPPLMLAISVFCAINDAIAALKPGVIPPLAAPATPEAIMRAVNAMRDM
ncbi:MAG TPA: xanthine dehydrogenase molybdopterin binding subunit [Aestuariivirgaceae bacterium]